MYFNQRLGTEWFAIYELPNVSQGRVSGRAPPSLHSIYSSLSRPCEGNLVQVQQMLLGLFSLGQQRSREVMTTYEVNHNKVIVGIATAAPTGAVRVQAAMERRRRLWGIWRIHLVQNKAESGLVL